MEDMTPNEHYSSRVEASAESVDRLVRPILRNAELEPQQSIEGEYKVNSNGELAARVAYLARPDEDTYVLRVWQDAGIDGNELRVEERRFVFGDTSRGAEPVTSRLRMDKASIFEQEELNGHTDAVESDDIGQRSPLVESDVATIVQALQGLGVMEEDGIAVENIWTQAIKLDEGRST